MTKPHNPDDELRKQLIKIAERWMESYRPGQFEAQADEILALLATRQLTRTAQPAYKDDDEFLNAQSFTKKQIDEVLRWTKVNDARKAAQLDTAPGRERKYDPISFSAGYNKGYKTGISKKNLAQLKQRVLQAIDSAPVSKDYTKECDELFRGIRAAIESVFKEQS